MTVKLDRSNKFPGRCFRCGVGVPANRGYLLARDAVDDAPKGRAKWLTLCNSKPCVTSVAGAAEVARVDQKAILADGSIALPDDEALLPFKRAMGSWSLATGWRASPHRRDRDHVIKIATALGMDVAPEFATYTDPKCVRDAVARARAVPTIREYQVEGVRRLAYVGIDDTDGCSDVPCFNMKDKLRGFVLADDMGLGKSLQTLLSLHDDEAVVIVCNAAAKAVWPREAKKWRPGRFDKFTTIEGEESFRWPTSPREMVIVNYDILRYTPAQISDEREHLHAKIHGHVGDADSRVKWKRKDIDGLLPPLFDLADQVSEQLTTCAQLDTTTGARHTLFETMLAWVEQSEKVHRKHQALRRNAKRRPVDKPTCPIVCVADELHYVENHKAQRTKRWQHLVTFARRVIGLTGTPVEAHPFKLRGLLESARANPFGWTAFLEAFGAFALPHGGYDFVRHPPLPGSTAKGSVVVQPGTTEQIGRVLMRRTKEQVLPELPPKVFSEIPVSISAKVRKELDEITAVHAPELLAGELPPFAVMSSTLKALSKACIPTLMDLVDSYEQQETPLVVFAANRPPVEALVKRKGWFGILGGQTGKGKIGEIEDAFQRGEGVGVAATGAGAESMTLTRASTVIQVLPFAERKKNQQAYDRLHRFGQRDTVNVIMLVPDHVLVHHMIALLVAKDQFVDDVLTGESAPEIAASRFTDEDADAWAARTRAKADADTKREESQRVRDLKQRERELARLASRDVTPALSEKRAAARAARLGAAVLHHGVDKRVVAAALDYMLSVCDGAREKDNQGFNQPDSCVARWLAPGVHKGSPIAVASATAILRHYPRQLESEYPTLFEAGDTCAT